MCNLQNKILVNNSFDNYVASQTRLHFFLQVNDITNF